jgi:hypothetical protein
MYNYWEIFELVVIYHVMIGKDYSMSITTLHEKVSTEINQLSNKQLKEVLLFIEFLSTREDKDFIDYVNSRTQQVMNDRKKGKKFFNLDELQKEFSEN